MRPVSRVWLLYCCCQLIAALAWTVLMEGCITGDEALAGVPSWLSVGGSIIGPPFGTFTTDASIMPLEVAPISTSEPCV